MEKYDIGEELGRGGFGIVYKVIRKSDRCTVAIKKAIDSRNENVEEVIQDYKDLDNLLVGIAERVYQGIPTSVLREVSVLSLLNECPNVVKLLDTFTCDEHGKTIVYIVFEYMEHNLNSFIDTFRARRELIPAAKVKDVMFQLLNGVCSCHSSGLLHRDLKPANILMNNEYKVVKVADFGLSRMLSIPTKKHTPNIRTLHYQAPEMLLGDRHYSMGADMWSVGCIFAELASTNVLFRGNKDSWTQISLIFRKLGTPNEESWPGVTKRKMYSKFKSCEPTFSPGDYNLDVDGIDLLRKMLMYDPSKRISAKDALKHPFFGI